MTFPQHVILLPHQDPSQYGVPDAVLDRQLAENSQVWRECMMYLQRFIVMLSSSAAELQTVRAAMNSWLPSNQADMDTMSRVSESGIDLDTQFCAMFHMFHHVTPEAFFQAAPSMNNSPTQYKPFPVHCAGCNGHTSKENFHRGRREWQSPHQV